MPSADAAPTEIIARPAPSDAAPATVAPSTPGWPEAIAAGAPVAAAAGPDYGPPPVAVPAAAAPQGAYPGAAYPPYGAAATPTSPAAPPAKSRTGLWIAIVVVALVVVVALALGALFIARSNRTIDAKNLETKLSAALTQEVGAPVTVSCPTGQPAKAGTTFECTASAAGQTRQIKILVEDDDGNVKWLYAG